MAQHVFLTGAKGVGKSTLLQKLLQEIPGTIGGFRTKRLNSFQPPAYTVHLLPPVGPCCPTADNLLFHCGQAEAGIATRFDRLGSAALSQSCNLLVMDELGPHEAEAEGFRAAILSKLDGNTPILGVLQQAESDFLREIQCHPKVRLFPVNQENRNDPLFFQQILSLLKPRMLYFLRHGQPAFPGGKKMCLGSTDLPLSKVGKIQAENLSVYFQPRRISQVFTSDLHRALETAQRIHPEPTILPGLRELDMGQWDGLTFQEIQAQFPELYRLRGENRNLPLPGAESAEAGLLRFRAALDAALAVSSGDIVLVGHRSILQAFFRSQLGREIPLDYGSITAFVYDGSFRLCYENHVPSTRKEHHHENHL